jgi:hypothetical protein
MNCNEFRDAWAGLDDSSRLSDAMESHRQLCRSCAQLVDDVQLIVQQARRMRLAEDPPKRVWANIQLRLEEEGLIREPASASPQPRAARPFWAFRFRMGLAYVAVFLVAVGTMYVQSLFQKPAAPPQLVVESRPPETGVPERDEEVRQLMEQLPAEHRAVIQSNWNQVTTSIDQLNGFLQEHPEDPFAQSQLLTAQQQRRRLLETMIRLEEF